MTTTVGLPGRPDLSVPPGAAEETAAAAAPAHPEPGADRVEPGRGMDHLPDGGPREGREADRADRGRWAPARDPLQRRVDALGELLGLSRTRVAPDALAEAGTLLDRVTERRRLSLGHTVVALAGATGSGKSSLFNAVTGFQLAKVGVRRPTTQRPLACAWDLDGSVELLDRLGIPAYDRFARRSLLDRGRRAAETGADLEGLVLLDLPDNDSTAPDHRRQLDRLLELVDVLVWVVDPEKYADAVLHERYLRPMAHHADVMLVVLNQVDRLPVDAADQVMDDLRRLLDEDGLALDEHGEPGTTVLATSCVTGEGIADLRAAVGGIVAERSAADRRLADDLDRATELLRPLYVGYDAAGLTEPAREEFAARLADAVGAEAVGGLARGEWCTAAARACGVPWSRLIERHPPIGDDDGSHEPVSPPRTREAAAPAGPGREGGGTESSGALARSLPPAAAHPLSPTAADPLLPAAAGLRPTTAAADEAGRRRSAVRRAASRPLVAEAVRALAADASYGLPDPWARAVQEAAVRGARGLPEGLDAAVSGGQERSIERPRWWPAVGLAQWLLMVWSLAGVVGLVAVAVRAVPVPLWLPISLFSVGTAGGPLLAWTCHLANRGDARRHGQQAERRLRESAEDLGRSLVLEPVAAELLRYQEVREQYGVAAGAGIPPARG